MLFTGNSDDDLHDILPLHVFPHQVQNYTSGRFASCCLNLLFTIFPRTFCKTHTHIWVIKRYTKIYFIITPCELSSSTSNFSPSHSHPCFYPLAANFTTSPSVFQFHILPSINISVSLYWFSLDVSMAATAVPSSLKQPGKVNSHFSPWFSLASNPSCWRHIL